MKKLLAIDTSSVACSVALEIGNRRYHRHAEREREHTRLLLPMVRELLDEAGIELGTLDGIVLGNGPGSFIGLRIAASVAQGLAHGAGLPLLPVSSLAAIAAEVFATSTSQYVAVAQDAHMNEVYLGLYRRGAGGAPVPLGAERLHGIVAIDELALDGPPAACAGAGWLRYPGLLSANAGRVLPEPRVLVPDARYLLSLADQAPRIAPADLEPTYLRQTVASRPA